MTIEKLRELGAKEAMDYSKIYDTILSQRKLFM